MAMDNNLEMEALAILDDIMSVGSSDDVNIILNP
jgi:hypothetical protein